MIYRITRGEKCEFSLVNNRGDIVDDDQFYRKITFIYEDYKSFQEGDDPIRYDINLAQKDATDRAMHALWMSGVLPEQWTLPPGYSWSAWTKNDDHWSMKLLNYGVWCYTLKLRILSKEEREREIIRKYPSQFSRDTDLSVVQVEGSDSTGN